MPPPDTDDTDDTDGSDDPDWRQRAARFLPRTPRGWVASVAALLYFAGTLGYMVGVRRDSPPGPTSVDVGFLQDMIAHHEQAIEMSGIELTSGTDPGVRSFAREILTFQAYEIGVMEGQLAEWGHDPGERSGTAMAWMHQSVAVDQMPGLASAEEMDALREAEGRGVDSLFVPLMQDHHRGGVHMADYAATAASDPAVRELAARMVRNQRVEVGELEAARGRAGLDPAPVGYVPAAIPADTPADVPAESPDDHTGHGG